MRFFAAQKAELAPWGSPARGSRRYKIKSYLTPSCGSEKGPLEANTGFAEQPQTGYLSEAKEFEAERGTF
ncbi:MAG: hypothetical protein QG632_74 [Candidatus Dependentiae bacterium]|nr:hypothetical protein [Candidatus Dependentiae bacterium]